MSTPRAPLRISCCFTSLQVAELELEKAKQLISKRNRRDVEAALVPIERALELRPEWEVALELKARVLLYLKRFKDVVDMLHEHLPSLQGLSSCTASCPSPPSSSSHEMPTVTHSIPTGLPDSPTSTSSKEKSRLLSEFSSSGKDDIYLLSPLKHCLSIAKLRHKLSMSLLSTLSVSHVSLTKAERQQQWRYLVLGQACFHLGMLEDAMALLQKGKKHASDISRRQSNGMREDFFCSDESIQSAGTRSASLAESDLVMHILANIKFLLRRRAAAMAALEAGLYAESVRHFSKIIDGRKGSTPQGFIADCYLHRAVAYHATGRVIDAISDCNRCLVLSPHCSIQALSVRASLYEMVRCYSDCLLDLQQLKIIYEASLRYQSMVPELVSGGAAATPALWQPHVSRIDFAGGLEYINSKITSTRQRLSSASALDAYTILDMPRNCTMQDVERAYLLISLKHRADKEVQFVERRDFTAMHDQRDPSAVKEEAQASALRLSHLIHKAYTKVLSSIAQEEADEQIEMSACRAGLKEEEEDRQVGFNRVGPMNGMSATEVEGGEEKEFGSLRWGSNGAEEEQDGCDFCQPFGGFSSSTLASALSQALSGELPLSSITWPADWALAHQPLPVT